MFYKVIQDNAITMLGKTSFLPKRAEEITEEKYNQLIVLSEIKPNDTLETIYYLSSISETYVGRETTDFEKVKWYVSAVLSKQMSIEDVPEEYREEVTDNVNVEEPITEEQAFINRLIEEVNS